MKINFWGCRGSIPVPDSRMIEYGGNTPCVEITVGKRTLILDSGTGIRKLGEKLTAQKTLDFDLFITHSHWDHIHGQPFFVPFFIPGNSVRIHGAFDVVSGQGVEQVMGVQLQYSYFPIREAELKARIEYRNMAIGETVQVGDAQVTSTLLNHPVIDYGYRVECNGRAVFFTGDHEPWSNIYEPGDEGYPEYQAMVDENQRHMDAALHGVDVLIVDCSYTAAEYVAKKGWGHATFDYAIALARRTGVKRLVCTHHEPTRSDDELERVFGEEVARARLVPGDPEVMLAREGLELTI